MAIFGYYTPKTFRQVESTLKPVGSPVDWPISLQDAKDRLEFGTTTEDDDRKIQSLIPVAVEMVETDCQRAIVNRTWKLYMDEFPCEEIELRMPPIVSVTSVTYTDSDGATQTVSSTLYDTDLVGEPGRIRPASGTSGWPTAACVPNAVTVNFTAGYGETPIPYTLIEAMLLALKALYYGCEPGEAYWSKINRNRWEGGL